MNKKNGIWEKKNFKVAVGVVNVCLIAGLIFYLVVLVAHTGSTEIKKELTIVGREYTEANYTDAMEKETSSMDMVDIYYTLIQGSHAEIAEGVHLYFGVDGTFEGFFDNEHPNVTGYTYELLKPVGEDGESYEADVNIYNADKSIFVQYKLMFDEDSNMQLYYPDSKIYILLSF